MRVVLIANQKGGIGKTTTATSLAAVLNRRGKKTLLVDVDAQCNATDVYRAETDGVYTMYDILTGEGDGRPDIKEAVQHTEAGDIVPGDRLLSEADTKLQSDTDGIYFLADALKGLEGYEYVVIDSNPNLNYLLFNCLVAADEVIIPVTADRFGIVGLSHLVQTINKIRSRQNPDLIIRGLLLVKFDKRTRLGRDTLANLEDLQGTLDTVLFNSKIRSSVKVQESQTMRMPLADYAPYCTSGRDYEALADELLEAWKTEGEKK